MILKTSMVFIRTKITLDIFSTIPINVTPQITTFSFIHTKGCMVYCMDKLHFNYVYGTPHIKTCVLSISKIVWFIAFWVITAVEMSVKICEWELIYQFQMVHGQNHGVHCWHLLDGMLKHVVVCCCLKNHDQ